VETRLNMHTFADNAALRDTVWKRISARRLLQTTYEFLCIPSPTGEEAAFAARYAATLTSHGMTVIIDDEFPASPSVIGRWGNDHGPTLQFDGHTDTIPTPHAAPSVDFAAGIVRGRGAADMKGGLAAVAEAVRAIVDSGVTVKGSVLVTAHGLHEAPLGDQRTLKSLIRKGISGDAAIVAELGENFLPLAAKGMAVFHITVSRPGTPMHEAEMPKDLAHPLWVMGRVVAALDRWRAELARTPDPLLGAESIFLGEMRGGDFYNRVPVSATLVGTHRYAAPRTLDDVRREYAALCEQVAAETDATIDVTFKNVGPPFRLADDAPIVRAVRAAYQAATDRELPIRGISVVGNAADLVGLAGIPAVYHGVNQTTAHSDDEYVSADDLERAAKVYAAVMLDYLSGTL
jgi:acetylornithine deacetylase/succinyl-diaminopimelate desuccinylase-like protein